MAGHKATQRDRWQSRARHAASHSLQCLGKAPHPPAHGPVQIGFVIGPEFVAIDIFGPWAAFGDASMGSTMMRRNRDVSSSGGE
jgi:hypothetical protein